MCSSLTIQQIIVILKSYASTVNYSISHREMEVQKCKKCKKSCIQKARPEPDELYGAPCDSCEQIFCKFCAKITTTEAHAVSLSQRSILFLCTDCRCCVEDISSFKKLREQYNVIKKEAQIKEAKIEQLKLKFNQQITELQNENSKLCNKTQEQDQHIEQLNKKNQEYTDSVLTSETSYIDTINEQKSQIAGLNKEINSLVDKNRSLSLIGEELQVKCAGLQKELAELNSIKDQMLVSIDVLTKENECYLQDLKKANYELLQRDNTHLTQSNELMGKNKTEKQTAIQAQTKSQLVIIGNRSCVTGTGKLIKQIVGPYFDINCQFADKFTLDELIEAYSPLATKCTSKDFIIVFTGNENAVRGQKVQEARLQKLKDYAGNTNLILVAPPFAANRHVLNRIIHETCLSVYTAISDHQQNTLFLNMDNFTELQEKNYPGHSVYSAKKRIMAHIGGVMLNWSFQTALSHPSTSSKDCTQENPSIFCRPQNNPEVI